VLRPCSLLSAAQLSQSELGPDKSGTALVARYCRWQKFLDKVDEDVTASDKTSIAG
jgi:hypothetical protein